MPRGGQRPGSGRPLGSGRYREQTLAFRIPLSLAPQVSELLADHALSVQAIPAGKRKAKKKDPWAQWKPPPAGRVALAGPVAARTALESLAARGIEANVVHLDPWYRRKSPRGRAAFLGEALPLLQAAASVGHHVFLWGWPESVARLIDHLPKQLVLESWLTWYFKNAASRGKSWRPSQQACLHLRRPKAPLYPENFYSEHHRQLAEKNRLEFKMTPRSVIESALLAGAIKKSEQTGYPAQKPVEVIDMLLRMTCKPGDLVVDPTAGSGTTAVAALALGCTAMLSDRSTVALRTCRSRLAGSLVRQGR